VEQGQDLDAITTRTANFTVENGSKTSKKVMENFIFHKQMKFTKDPLKITYKMGSEPFNILMAPSLKVLFHKGLKMALDTSIIIIVSLPFRPIGFKIKLQGKLKFSMKMETIIKVR
jgi:hypothetical protein